MKLHVRALLTGSLLAALAPFASAHAAAGPPGSLDAVRHAAALLRADSCQPAAPALPVSRALAPSPSAPTAATSTPAAAPRSPTFQRDAKTGALTQLAGPLGCVSSSVGGCGHALGLSGVSQIALSPGRPLPLRGLVDRELGHRRSRATSKTGALTQLKGAAGLRAPRRPRRLRLGRRPARRDRARDRARTAAASTWPAATPTPSPRSRSTRPAARCCSSAASRPASAAATTPAPARPVARSRASTRSRSRPTALTLYAAAKDADAVAVLQRDATTGALTQQPGPTGCIRLAGGLGCTTGRALAQPSALAIAAGGRDIYVASASGNAVSILQRDAATRRARAARRRRRLHRPGHRRLRVGSAADGARRARDRRRRHEPDRGDRRRRRDPHAPAATSRPALLAPNARARGLHLDDRRGRLPGARAARRDDLARDRRRAATRSTRPPAAA